MNLPWEWGARPEEVAQEWGADRWAPATGSRGVRAISVSAPPEVVFAWLGNLRVAPYSYDLVDNLGRKSPRVLRLDLGSVAVGDRVMTIFTAAEVVPNEELVLVVAPGRGQRIFGDVVVSYSVVAADSGSRLVAALHVAHPDGPAARARAAALGWGDLLMMRKQLRTLAALAEASPSLPR